MTKGVPIEGRVVDADGRPVAGAAVFSSSRQDSLGTGVREFAVTTDGAGHFRTGQVRPGEYYLVARPGATPRASGASRSARPSPRSRSGSAAPARSPAGWSTPTASRSRGPS